jgi:formamidopyrimidine-DNA glycosylase
MPELPEVETVRRGLMPKICGKRIKKVTVHQRQFRYLLPSHFEKTLERHIIERIDRRGKYLVGTLSSGNKLLIHLGMSGSFKFKDAIDKHDHIEFIFDDNVVLTYHDPRRFGFLKIINSSDDFFEKMGPEPFSELFSVHYLMDQLKKKNISIKQALLDQSLIAGIGNIYASEILFESKISPFTKVQTLDESDIGRIIDETRIVLDKAIKAGGSSLKDHRQTNGEMGYFQHQFKVYNREGELCRLDLCKGLIVKCKQNQRATYYCPSCQN